MTSNNETLRSAGCRHRRHRLPPGPGAVGGAPRRTRPAHRARRGLYFTGFTNPISGMFREMAIDAQKIARAVARAK
jgi:putative flavoprotein involved in K+ transport